MFVKRDLRKVQEILDDAIDNDTPLVDLPLGRRASEFQDGSISVLCNNINGTSVFNHLTTLSLYGNSISSITNEEISYLSKSPLKSLNLGLNNLSTLPSDLSLLSSLEDISLEQNAFTDFPSAVLSLPSLSSLRLSRNEIREIPHEIKMLAATLTLLCVDENKLQGSCNVLGSLTKLEVLNLRGNAITEIQGLENLSNLRILSLNSNNLNGNFTLSSAWKHLEYLYLNGNKELSEIVASSSNISLDSIKKLNFSSTAVKEIPMTIRSDEEWLVITKAGNNINDIKNDKQKMMLVNDTPYSKLLKDNITAKIVAP